jgi:hypothetical protein
LATVLPLVRPARRRADTPPEPSLQRRVRLGSRVLSIGFACAAVLATVLLAAGVGALLFYQGDGLRIGPSGVIIGTPPWPAGFITFATVPLVQKLAYAVTAVVRFSPKVAILLNQAALFGLYAQGVVFDRRNARRIRDTGLWLIADGALPFVCHLVLSSAGLEIDHRWAHLGSLQELILGAVVVVIAEVMHVGREIEEDRSQFV